MSTFIDPRDQQTYRTVELNGLRWMADNLNYDVGEGCWFYNNDPKNGERYGRLYTWEAAKKACPEGWRLPTDDEWHTLAMAHGGLLYDGCDKGDPQKAYSALIEGGSTGFSALLGGCQFGGNFYGLDDYGNYWSATEFSAGFAWSYNFDRNNGKLYRSYYNKALGFSVRCVQDIPFSLTEELEEGAWTIWKECQPLFEQLKSDSGMQLEDQYRFIAELMMRHRDSQELILFVLTMIKGYKEEQTKARAAEWILAWLGK